MEEVDANNNTHSPTSFLVTALTVVIEALATLDS
jgi:hypothetical protein